MRVLVTGGNGLLGTAVSKCFSLLGHRVLPLGSADTDITNLADSRISITGFKPDLVVHTAAMTDVDGCERDKDTAFRVNAIGAWNVAASCEEAGAKLVFISTDFVFDGEKKSPYTEFDVPRPINIYGSSKLTAERLVREACPRTYIIRTSWLFGPMGKSFPKTILRKVAEGADITVVSDQIGAPTYVDDLALSIADIVQVPMFGTYHICNSGQCSWYEFAEAIVQASGRKDVSIVPISSEDWKSPTIRPAYSVLRPYVRELQGKPPLRSWKHALKEFMQRGVSLD